MSDIKKTTLKLGDHNGMYVCMYVCMYTVYYYVCMYVCMYVYMYVCMYACMYVCTCVYIPNSQWCWVVSRPPWAQRVCREGSRRRAPGTVGPAQSAAESSPSVSQCYKDRGHTVSD